MAAPTIEEVSQAVEQLDKILEFAHEAEIGQRLLALFESASTLIVHHMVDPETGTDDGYTVTACLPAAKPVTCSREELLDAIRAVFSNEKGKRCRACRKIKPLSAFSRLAESKDGHNRRCKMCERKRVNRYEEDRRDSEGRHGPGAGTAPAEPAHAALRQG